MHSGEILLLRWQHQSASYRIYFAAVFITNILIWIIILYFFRVFFYLFCYLFIAAAAVLVVVVVDRDKVHAKDILSIVLTVMDTHM